MPSIFLGVGSNIEPREENISKAISLLKEKGFKIVKSSPIYQTQPVGYESQPKFLNLVLHIEEKTSPKSCLYTLKEIERDMGRTPTFPNGPRVIDLDILFYDSLIVDTPELKIPHPRLHKRAFVLIPLSQIAPDFLHPVFKKSVKELLKEVDTKGVEIWKRP